MADTMEKFKNFLLMLLDTTVFIDGNTRPQVSHLRRLVADAGFEAHEADELVDWVVALRSGGVSLPETTVSGDFGDGPGVRVFADSEREFLDPEAFGYLLALDNSGQISTRQRENILHFLSHAAVEPLGLEDVGEIVDQVLLQRIEEQGSGLPPIDGGMCH